MRWLISALAYVLLTCASLAQVGQIPIYSPVVTGGGTFTTFNPADLSQITLSNGNLTATGTGAGGVDGGVRSITSKSSGKLYFEFTPSLAGGADTGFGVVNGSTAFTVYANDATGGANLYRSGNLWAGGSNVVPTATPIWVNGNPIGIAIDVGAKLMWATVNGTTWNNGAGTPAAGTGGASFSGATGPFFFAFTNTNGNTDNVTVNAGATAFSFSVPSGFTAGWP